jgi:hypothetical protein
MREVLEKVARTTLPRRVYMIVMVVTVGKM